MSNKFTTYVLTVPMLLSTLSLFAQNNTSLSFDGTTQYATTDPGANPIPTFTPVTVELWAYVPSATPGIHAFVSQGPDGAFPNQFGIGFNGDDNHIWLGDQWPDANVVLPTGQWNHIALTYNGADSARLFLNGVQVDSLVDGSYFILNGIQLQLGRDVNSGSYFQGKLDQMRVWNYARSADQIKAGMYGTIDTTDANILVNYLFDTNPGVIHNSGSTVGADLTLVNTPLTPASPLQAAQNSLSFRSTSFTKAVAPGSSLLDLTAGTIEAWVNPNTVNGAILSLGDTTVSTATRFTVMLDNTSLPSFHTVGIRSSSSSLATVTYPLGFTAGSWYHLALVTAHDAGGGGDTTAVYVNADYRGKINQGYFTGVAANGKPLTIGANGYSTSENWDGNIDDVSIWNTPLSQAQIAANMASSPTGNEPNLVAFYNFDQGITDGDNAGVKVVVDYAPPTNNATMSNFSLAASSSTNFTVGHSASPLPILLTEFTATKQSNTALLKWSTGQEQNSRDFIIERSSNGIDFTDIGTVAAAGTSHTKRYYAFTDNTPLEGKNYYRLREIDLDGKPTFSAIRALSFTMSGNLIWYSTGTNAAEVRLHNGSNEMYTILDMSGHTLRIGRLSSGVAPVSQLPSGVYFVKVVTNAGNELTAKVLLK